MSLRPKKQKVGFKKERAIEHSDQVLYEQAIIIACIVGIAITLLWSSVGRIQPEKFSVLYLIPGTYPNYISSEEVSFRYGVQCFEERKTEYLAKFYLNGEVIGRKIFTLAPEQVFEETKSIIVNPDTDFPANLSVVVKSKDEEYEVHFWIYHTPPMLKIEEPQNNSLVNFTDINISGKVQRDSYLMINDMGLKLNGSSFRYQNFSLKEGENLLTFTAQDSLGNITKKTLSVILDSKVLLEVFEPKDNITTKFPYYAVTGVVRENATVIINKIPVEVINGSFSYPFNLTSGRKTITIRANDSIGNVLKYFRTVTLDTSSKLLISSPQNESNIGDNFVTVSGIAEKGSKVVINGVEVYMDGSGGFNTNVELVPGENRINILALDSAGNSITQELKVFRDTMPPQILEVGPKGFQSSNDVVLTVTTNEDAFCRWSSSLLDYAAMQTQFSFGEETKEHYTPVTARTGETAFYISCEDIFQNRMLEAEKLTVSVGVTAPMASNPRPNGEVTSTTQTLRVNTDEESHCRYSGEDEKYGEMTKSFSETGEKRHSTRVSGLSEGSHTYYVRCKNEESGITMVSSLKISFKVDSKNPKITESTTEEIVSTPSAYVRVKTDEQCVCRLDFEDKDFGSMVYTMGGEEWTHSLEVNLEEGENQVFVRCKDDVGNVMSSSHIDTISLDITPPVVSDPLPQGSVSTPMQTLSVNTDEIATCRYDLSDKTFSSMDNTFSVTDSTIHYSPVEASTGSNTYYIRCSDEVGNKMESSILIQFTVE
ncbi:hypothetical protein ACFLRC_01185 [Candidatus Altiarchaeota archaeon]